MNKKRESKRPWDYKEWACPCGAKTGMMVVRTHHDEYDRPLRIRQCRNCGDHMATVETPINFESFYARAESHRIHGLKSLKRKPRYCKYCERKYGEEHKMAQYRYGNYSNHINLPTHMNAIKGNPTPAARRIQAAKSRSYYWTKQGLEDLSIGKVLLDAKGPDGQYMLDSIGDRK